MATSPQLHGLLPASFALQHRIAPLEASNGTLRVAVCEEGSRQALSDLEFITGKRVESVLRSEEEVLALLQQIYGEQQAQTPAPVPTGQEFQVVEKSFEEVDNGRLLKETDDTSVIKLVNQIITEAIVSGASDIHIEAYEQQFRVRYRLDGVLQERARPALEKKRAIISRLKIMADLDIAEKRRPQDGRIRVRRGEQVIDIRVSTLPTDFGEKIVLRILDKSQLNLELEKLGFEAGALSLFKNAIQSPHGMVLVTGPTGSGKTTTLYAALNQLNSPEVNILTIEDPIEYHLNGINQSQVKSDIGFTFAKALRAFLRQDPDIIMVGEIRDQETAEIAVRAALTGHLVLSTLHTNDAPGTLTRLMDMGLEPFLISSSVKLVMAQRLVRKICEHCKVEDDAASGHELLNGESNTVALQKLYKGKGCAQCNMSGYRGRTAIFEVMPITPAIAELINRRATAQEIGVQACAEGMKTLHESAVRKLGEGVTSYEEVCREAG